MPAVTLQNPNRVATPQWLTDDSASTQLKDTYNQLGSLFDTSGLQNAANQWRDTSMARFEMGADAMSRAAQNRAMLSGGRVGASFAKGGLMLGAMDQGNRMNLDFAKLAAQMRAQQAGMQGQLAGNIADFGQRRQGLLSDFTQGQQRMRLTAQQANQQAALERARMAQQAAQFESSQDLQSSQFDRNYDLQQQQSNASLQDAAARRAAMALQAMGRGGYSYATGPGGIPLSYHDAQQKYLSDTFQQRRQGLINQITGG